MLKKRLLTTILLSTIIVGSLGACGTSVSTSTPSDSSTATVTTEPSSESSSISVESSSNTTESATTTPPDGGTAGGMTGGAVDKSSDEELQTMIAEVLPKFQQLEYTDSETGLSITYNLYVPADYDASKSYPLVMFISDSSSVGTDATTSLSQGWGGLIWATDEEQAKHESIVLVPTYPDIIIDDHGSYTTTDYIDLTARLLKSIESSYSVDKNRVYGTGQSMGCMTTLVLASEYPDLFTAELFVSGQWDISKLEPLATQKFFYIAAAGDDKASVGQTDVEKMLDTAETTYTTAEWDATWSSEESNSAVASILSSNNNINIPTFKLGTVLPAGVEVGTSEHMYSFDYAYKIEAVRDWLFSQTK